MIRIIWTPVSTGVTTFYETINKSPSQRRQFAAPLWKLSHWLPVADYGTYETALFIEVNSGYPRANRADQLIIDGSGEVGQLSDRNLGIPLSPE